MSEDVKELEREEMKKRGEEKLRGKENGEEMRSDEKGR